MILTDVISRFAASCGPGGLLPSWYKYLDSETIAGKCTPKFDVPADTSKILLAVFEIVLRLGTFIAIGYIIYGGFTYIISQGEPDKAKTAKSTIINALIGLVIALFATAIVNFVGNRFI